MKFTELKLEGIYQKIWGLSLPYQDKRNDEGHAEIATCYALEIVKEIISHEPCTHFFDYPDYFPITRVPKVKKEVAIPAIILHDIGWSQMPEDKLMIAYNPPSKEAEYTARLEHQIYALPLAAEILGKVNYPAEHIPEILLIISQHDTRKNYWTINDAIVRDADKLWRYSQRHLEVTAKNKGWKTKNEAKILLTISRLKIDEPGFFMTEEAKKIARRDLVKLVIPEWLE